MPAHQAQSFSTTFMYNQSSLCYGYLREYRYGFQGQEKDDEIKGSGNSINFKYRMHDPRLGRFFAVDPLFKKYPWNSPYAFAENKVIQFVELEGLEVGAQPGQLTKNGWTTAINTVRSSMIPELIEQRLTADYPIPSLASQLFPLPTGGGQCEISLGISKKGFGLAVGTDSDGNLSLKSEFKNAAGLKLTMMGKKKLMFMVLSIVRRPVALAAESHSLPPIVKQLKI